MSNWFVDNPGVTNILITIGLLIGSWLIGTWLAGALRVRDYSWKFSCILFALFASIVIIWRGWPPKLGIDLGGGAVLVYQVDHTKTEWRSEKMDSLVAAISERVNPGGQKEISVRSLGDDMVQIIMPTVSGATDKDKQSELEEVKKIIRTTGAMEFLIVATRLENSSDLDKAATLRKEACLKNPGDPKFGPEEARVYYGDKLDPYTGQRKALGKWCPVRDKEQDAMRGDGAAIEVYGKDKDGKDKNRLEVFVLAPENKSTEVTGRDIADARPEQGPKGQEVAFRLKSDGAAKMGKLTGDHLPQDSGARRYKLAIVLDNELQSAPYIEGAISDSGVITGDFTKEQVQDLSDIINRGALPAALQSTPEREMVSEATLGAETIHQSLRAMAMAAIFVPLFMIFYYRFAGVIAVIVLSLTILMLVAIMVLVKAPFTLTALAGLALSVGMEVDNNVLIYERLREELSHGAALRMGLRNSFHRVGVVIVDANITHVLAAAVLFYIGTEQVKGFAITFLLGALLSIWATMFVAKTLFEVAERRFRIQKINMMHVIGHTTIDFMHWFKACLTFSILITVLGLAVAVYRGSGLFDIDFTGGISMQTIFKDKADVQNIRAEIAKHGEKKDELPDATVTPVQNANEPIDRRFVFDTSNPNGKEVQDMVAQLFAGQLVTADMQFKLGAPQASPGAMETPKDKALEKLPPPRTSAAPAVPSSQPKPSDDPHDMTAPQAPSAPPAHPTEAPKPAEPKTSAAPPTAPATPKSSGKQSAINVLPVDLANMVEPEIVIDNYVDVYFDASAGTAEAKSTAKPAVTPETKTPAPTATTQPAPAVKAVAPAPAKSQAMPAAKPETKTESKPAQPAASTPPAKVELSSSEVVPAQPIQATLTFTVLLAHQEGDQVVEKPQDAKYEKDQLRDMIEKALEANHLPRTFLSNLSDPDQAAASNEWTVTFMPLPGAKVQLTDEKVQAVLKTVQAAVAKQPYFPGVDNMGTAVAGDTQKWACLALVLSWLLIIGYLWIRFQGVAFGVAAVIALVHDVLVMLGAVAFSSYLARIPGVTAITLIEPFKINLTIVAAFLTIIGYSVNDTIVVFDRIREIRGKSPTLTRQMVNDATNQTLSRTVLTSFTVLLVVLILYVFGGQAVHGFAFALFIGVLTGTYSSIYVAAPILLWLLHPKEMKASGTKGEAA